MATVAGLMTAVVVDVDDPDGHGRVKLRYPDLPGSALSGWTQIAAPMGGRDRGVWLIPEVGDVAVVAFERGSINHPYVLGFVWNDEDEAPSTSVHERMIRSVNGHTIRLLDSTPTGGNSGGIAIEDAHGNSVVLTNGKVSLTSTAVLELNAPVITLTGPGYRRVVVPNSNPI